MFGRDGQSVDIQIRYLEGEIGKVHLELLAIQHRREDAIHAETRAMHAIDQAHAALHRSDRDLEEHLEALHQLRAEIAELIPKPRQGA